MSAVDALQATLASEHAAVWTYAVLAARTSQSAEPALFAALSGAYREHRARRDQAVWMIRDAGGEPVAAEPAYARPAAATAAERSASAAALEERCSDAYAWQVAHTTHETRAWAIAALAWSASQIVTLGGAAAPWPGAPELTAS